MAICILKLFIGDVSPNARATRTFSACRLSCAFKAILSVLPEIETTVTDIVTGAACSTGERADHSTRECVWPVQYLTWATMEARSRMLKLTFDISKTS